MRRRDLIKILASALSFAPPAAHSQQGQRRIGVLMGIAPADSQGQKGLAAFKAALEELGWVDGRNVQVDVRWGDVSAAVTRPRRRGDSMRTLQKVLHVGPIMLMLAWPSQAPAQNIDALDVTLPNCRDWLDVFDHKKAAEGTRTEGLNQGRCIGIVEGLFAADPQTCAPDGVNLAQSVRLVVSYIDSLPEPRQDNFKALVLEAIRKAWPCKNK